MLVIRATAKVLKKLKVEVVEEPPPSSGVLGDWYCNFAIIQKQHILLCVSQKTLLPIILSAKDLASFPTRLRHELGEVLAQIGVSPEKIATELSSMESVLISKTASRQILGSMNDFLHMLDAYLNLGTPLTQMTWRLGEAPCSPINMSTPLIETARIFEVLPIRMQHKPPQLKLIKSDL
jgi:hypothetical protein